MKLKLINDHQDYYLLHHQNLFKEMIKRQIMGIVPAMKKARKFFMSAARK